VGLPQLSDQPAAGQIAAFYDAMLARFGPQNWWPANTPTEMVIGAILTQNTAWRNVEKAIGAMAAAGALDFARLHAMTEEEIVALIRPAGTFRIKARRLKAFVEWLMERGGDLGKALSGDLAEARAQLLSVSGVGPETADAILLYAAHRPSFVVDAYTLRILRRHGLVLPGATYAAVKALFESALPPDAALFNEYHALIVEVGKRHCRPIAQCAGCPLESFPHDATA
jgi:endonuclease-3 related protein